MEIDISVIKVFSGGEEITWNKKENWQTLKL